MTEPSDEDLVQKSRHGDVRAFDAIVERHQRTVYNLALRMVRDPDEAADVAQAVFVKAYEKLKSFDPKFKFFSWLYRIAVNEALNVLEMRKRFDGLEGIEPAEEADEGSDDEAIGREQRIQDSLMMLNVDHRAVIVLKHMQGLSYQEIAQILSLPEKTVKSRLFSARQTLRDILMRKGLGSHDSKRNASAD
ncbi:MAG TPA: sigma-70 family RNA polymerase sigma factor [Bacteroidota bacterium]|nr:sigma-70 family RNA polymerase sigma factor [Bacteroidota bacterium]